MAHNSPRGFSQSTASHVRPLNNDLTRHGGAKFAQLPGHWLTANKKKDILRKKYFTKCMMKKIAGVDDHFDYYDTTLPPVGTVWDRDAVLLRC